MDDMMSEMLKQILEPQALERLNTIKLVKPEKVQRVSQKLIEGARSGRLRNQIDMEQLTKYLEEDDKKNKASGKIKFDRRRRIDDSDDDDDNDDDL